MSAVAVSFVCLCLLSSSSSSSSSSLCPWPCSCSDRSFRHILECSFKDLSEIPRFLPPNATTVSLSANKISSVPAHSFRNTKLVTSLWMTGNRILNVENGAISNLIYLRNLDLSHNKLRDFPWTDLQNLTSLQLLKLDHNELENIPQNAFSNLKEVNSLWLNNNKFATIFKGTFDGLVALSFLQLHSNPFSCACYMYWLKFWILNAKINIPDRNLIICASPDDLKGKILVNLSVSNCQRPIVTINIENEEQIERFYEGGLLVLTCEYSGSPEPAVKWRINSRKVLELKLTENDSAEMLDNSLKVYNNRTLVVSNLKKEDSGVYSCFAVNEAGQDVKSVVIEVSAEEKLTMANDAKATQFTIKTTPFLIVEFNSGKATENHSKSLDKDVRKCHLSPDTKYVSGFLSNDTFVDVKQYLFDFETEAIVWLNSMLTPQDQKETTEEEDLNRILLCLSSDQNAVQWTYLKDGISAYYFANLRPSMNYSLCLTLKGEECNVQVHFTTRERIPNFIIIYSVSICLLTVPTVLLLVAVCYHLLMYTYRRQTYEMYLKARRQCRAKKAFRVEMESEKDLSEVLVEDKITDSGEKHTEEIILADLTSAFKLRKVESKYSDRLPLGAEAE